MTHTGWRLQSRLMLAFSVFALLTAAIFGGLAITFMYVVEDTFLVGILDQEAANQLHRHAQDGQWARPRDASISLHPDSRSFPADLRARFDAEPWRREFAGAQSRHYHLKEIVPPARAQSAWLVAEVSGQLVVRPMRDRIVRLLAYASALVVGLALLAGYWLARRTAKPLARLAATVDAMSPERPPDVFAGAYSGHAEIGVLARGLEALAGRVTAFVTREQEFTRDASHELRTPLTVIRSAAERLAAEPGLSAAGRQHLSHVQHSTFQLEQTVATLLSLARDEPLGTPVAPVRIVPILERVVVEQSPLLAGKTVAIEFAVPASARIALPAPILHILLSNLVGNAFAHTQAGAVTIDVEGNRLRIANTGDGADPASRWQLAQPYDKCERSAGFGLGLVIVRRLCDRYAIDLRFEGGSDKAIASIAIDIADH